MYDNSWIENSDLYRTDTKEKWRYCTTQHSLPLKMRPRKKAPSPHQSLMIGDSVYSVGGHWNGYSVTRLRFAPVFRGVVVVC